MALTTLAVFFVLLVAASATQQNCPADTLAVYRVVLNTHWTKELFPKQYPEFRPPAQWSRLLGRSHDDSFQLFSEGRLASAALRQFAEIGKSDLFEAQRQGFDGIMDTFGADAITTGEGRTSAKFYLDSNHSKVSLLVRMVPSPDWFIGVNSINLCNSHGKWDDRKELQLTLMDAGTDSGFTFTSPNWKSDPPMPISIITSKYPDHPANSFYYPELDHLPVIATLQFNKVQIYNLKEEFSFDLAPRANGGKRIFEENQDVLSNKLDVHPKILTSVSSQHVLSVGSEGPISVTQTNRDRRVSRNQLRALRMRKLKNRRMKKQQQQQQQQQRQQSQQRMDEHCELSQWSLWSPCSATCGTGTAIRRRTVVRKGRHCPELLEQSTWCSGYGDCAEKFFKW
ncbi:spondin-2-like isoform X2 [Neocloeon triangulifer]|uniref:spondin-2-like isoform X2 n=1 Tax=Neocloeon triangulifer TaxID=2078957 RepID=UPI00286F498B|nr:spondin-2-like isoform X2 [Neocloeon triangulifer]